MDNCKKCQDALDRKKPGYGYWSSREGLNHWTFIGDRIANIGKCLNVCKIGTLCGLIWEEEVDSSD